MLHTLRKSRYAVAALIAAVCTVTATAALAGTAQPGSHHASQSVEHQLNGTWTTTVQLTDAPPGAPTSFTALDTFLPGGSLVVSSSAPMPASRSLAHGLWTWTGHRDFTATFVWFRFDATGLYVGTQRVERTMHVSKSGSRFHATDVIEIIAPTGAVVATIHGTEVGTQLAPG